MSAEKAKSSYSLRKATELLVATFSLFKKKRQNLSEAEKKEILATLDAFQKTILEKDKKEAYLLSKKTEKLAALYLKKTPFDHLKELVFSLGIALVIAIAIRQCWFEPYAIPSGSMRPTLKEQDKLLVTKSNFGINVPLKAEHISFDPSLVKRSGIVIFTGENMDIFDVHTRYFFLIPSYKQYVKRLIGKPNDTLYFYGGKIYGIDSAGNDISKELQFAAPSGIDFIPFIHFEGKIATPLAPIKDVYSSICIYQMNEPVARLYLNSQNLVKGEMLPRARTSTPGTSPLTEYAELWGFSNYATARLLTKEQVEKFQQQPISAQNLAPAKAYLELSHHPSLTSSKVYRDAKGRKRPRIGLSRTYLPLQEEQLKALAGNLYTARFVVKNGRARRLGADHYLSGEGSYLPEMRGLPNGTYEFYFGKAYEIGFGGIATELPSNHPIYEMDIERLQTLFNLGIEFDKRFMPLEKNQILTPSRYAYFRDGDLFVMGNAILKKETTAMDSYIQREKVRSEASPLQRRYRPFIDAGPPLNNDGSLNIELIKQYGLRIPEKSYLVLGDNHAMSGDSRDFGFVPEDNLQGAPALILWPPGGRFGLPSQPSYPIFVQSRLIIWTIVTLSTALWYGLYRRRHRLPLNLYGSTEKHR